MRSSLVTSVVALLLLHPGSLSAEESIRKLGIRVLVHDPVRPVPELHVADDRGGVVPLNLVSKDLSGTQQVRLAGDRLAFYSSSETDTSEPGESLIGSVRIPPSAEKAIVVLFPEGDGKGYRGLVIDDSAGRFPNGTSRVINGTPVEIAVRAGEHRLAVKPGAVLKIPPVSRKNDFNFAQTDFFYRLDEKSQWTSFSERQLKFVDSARRIFVTFVSKGAVAPAVSTVLDTGEVVIPAE